MATEWINITGATNATYTDPAVQSRRMALRSGAFCRCHGNNEFRGRYAHGTPDVTGPIIIAVANK